MKKTVKKNSGITLVALVVTVVVLIIIAGISTLMILGKNGIINKSAKARDDYANSQADEDFMYLLSEYQMEADADDKELKTFLTEKKEKQEIDDMQENEDQSFYIIKKGHMIQVDKKGKLLQGTMKADIYIQQRRLGLGTGKDGIVTKSMTIPVTSNNSIATLNCENLKLEKGETITTDKPCAGLYIYSFKDIIIDGTINMSGKGYYTTEVPNTIKVANTIVTLAMAGAGGNSRGGAGGNAVADYRNYKSGGSGGIAYGTTGNHTCGGYGNRVCAGGGGGGYAVYDCGLQKAGSNGSNGNSVYEKDHCTKGAGTITLIAYGNVIINGKIISNGERATNPGSTGSSAGGAGGGARSAWGGSGGSSGTGGDGGGAVTIIYGDLYQKNGEIQLNGGASAGSAGSGSSYSSRGYYGYSSNGGSGGSSGAGGNGNVVTRQVPMK